MKELGSVWNNLNSLQKSQIGNDLFGKDNITTGYAILENYEKLDEVVNSLNNSTGSVNSEFNRYLDSTSGKIQQLKDAILEMWTSFVSSDTTKKVVESLIKLVDTFGNLQGVILLVTTAIMIFKGKAILGLITSLPTMISELIAYQMALGATSKATALLSGVTNSLKLAFMSNPLGILAVGLTTVIALMGQAKTSADKFNDSIQAFSKANDSYNTAKENSSLLTQYQELENKLSNAQMGTQQYTEATEELHEVQIKLAESFPQLIDGFDEEGNALVRNTSKIQQAIKQQTQNTILQMKNAIEQTEQVLESKNTDFSGRVLVSTKHLENISDKQKEKYFENGSKSLTYENTYKLFREMQTNKQDLTIEQSNLYSDAYEKLTQYNDEVSKLYAQTKDLNTIKNYKIFDFKENEFVNAKQWFQQIEEEQARTEARSASMTAKIQAYSDAGLTASQISDKLHISLEDVTYAMGTLGDETQDTTTAMKDLSDSYSDNVNKANLLQDVIEEFKSSGGLSLETKDKIFSSDYQDIIQAMGDENTFLQKAQGMLNDCMTEAEGLENKMLSVANSTVTAGEASNDMANNYSYNFNVIMKLINEMVDQNAKELDSLAKQYNVDLKNKENAENEKAKLVNGILNAMDSSTATMLNGLGNKYGVDVDNFSKAQQAKINILNDFLQKSQMSATSYENMVNSSLPNLKKQMEKEEKMQSGAIPSKKYATSVSNISSGGYSPNKVGNTPIGTTGVSSSGGGSNGGSGTEKDYSVENLDLKDYIESHYKLEDKIRDVQHQQDLLSKSIENTYGKNKVRLQNQYIDKLKEEKKLQQQLLNEQKQELNSLQNQLKGYNAHFDASGNIANMTEMYYHWITIANSINDSTESGANQKKQAQERVKNIKELVDKYRSLQEEIQSTESAFNGLSDTMKDVFEQMSDVCIEAEELTANAITEYIEDIYDKNTEVLDKLRNKIDKTFEENEHDDTVADYQKQLLEIRSSIEDAVKTGNSSLVKQLQEEYADVQKEYSKYMKDYEKDKALEKLDEEQEKLDKQKEDMLTSENLTKLVTQAMTEGFVNVNGTVVELNTLMTDFTKNNTVGMQNLVNETANWNQTLMTAINTASQLTDINSNLGLNTSFTYTKAMQDSVNKALKNVSTTTNKNLNVTSPLVVIENVTSDNYNDIIDSVTSQIYTTLNKALD